MLDSAGELVSITFYPLLFGSRLRFPDYRSRDIFMSANASLPTHARLSALGCLDYDVGVSNLYKGFGFPFPLWGDSPVADWQRRNAMNLDDLVV